MKKGGLEETMENESMDEGAAPEKHELDRNMSTLVDAEKIKADPKMMKHLRPHMEKHQAAMHKITSLDQLKMVAKKKQSEPDAY